MSTPSKSAKWPGKPYPGGPIGQSLLLVLSIEEIVDLSVFAAVGFLLLVRALRGDARLQHAQYGGVTLALDYKAGAQGAHAALGGLYEKGAGIVMGDVDQYFTLEQFDTPLLTVKMDVERGGAAQGNG